MWSYNFIYNEKLRAEKGAGGWSRSGLVVWCMVSSRIMSRSGLVCCRAGAD